MVHKFGWALAGLLLWNCAQNPEPVTPDAGLVAPADAGTHQDGGEIMDSGVLAQAGPHLQVVGTAGQARSDRYRMQLTVGNAPAGASAQHVLTAPSAR